MRYIELISKVEKDKFKKIFGKLVATNVLELEYGEPYGYICNETFTIRVKTKPHTLISCIEEYLHGEFDANGTIRYMYRRSLGAICFSRIAPIISLILGCIGYIVTHETSMLIVPFIMSLFFVSYNFIKSSKLRATLYDTMSRVVEKATE